LGELGVGVISIWQWVFKKSVGVLGLSWYGADLGHVTGSFEHGHERSVWIRCRL